MNLNEYQERAMQTCMDSCRNHAYMLFGLDGEVGELLGKIAKYVRQRKIEFNGNSFINLGLTDEERYGIKAEIGDCQWFISGIATMFGWPLEEVCQENLDKLASRKERGVIDGNGDFR